MAWPIFTKKRFNSVEHRQDPVRHTVTVYGISLRTTSLAPKETCPLSAAPLLLTSLPSTNALQRRDIAWSVRGVPSLQATPRLDLGKLVPTQLCKCTYIYLAFIPTHSNNTQQEIKFLSDIYSQNVIRITFKFYLKR